MYTLRPHQADNLQQLREALRSHRSVLLAAECGYGKGVITTHIIDGARRKGKHVLFTVYGKDRVNDMDERVTNLGIEHGVLMGSRRRERWHPVQVASVSTLHKMQHKPPADLIVIDEAHLGLSPTFREVLDQYSSAKIIGLTATPMLGNGRALGVKSGGIFESMVKGPSVKQLIREGNLVGSVVIAPSPPSDLAGLRKKKTGEFDEEQGAAICDTSKVIGDIVDHWERYSSDRKTVAFGFNQKHAFDIAESFRARGHNFAYVDANTPDGDIHTPGTRKFIWHQYDHGDLVGVAAVGVISIGWDHSVAKCLLLCSKTASFPLYRQRLGRGSRPHPGFDNFRIHDHTGNLFEFQDKGAFFESEIDWQLDGDPIKLSEEDKSRKVYTCKNAVEISDLGVHPGFRGPVDKGWMLPCLQPFSPGPKQCPNCGIPLVVNTKEIAVEEGELQEITQEMREAAEANIRAESKRKAEYLDLVRLAKQRGYKSGYALVVFRSKFGHFPPKGWKAECEAIA